MPFVMKGFTPMLRTALTAVLFLATAAGGAFAGPVEGKTLAKQKCQVCHGIDGIAKIPIAPHLAGEAQVYLQNQLKNFRSGKREHEMMSVVAKDLSDDDIVNLASWYSSITITATMPDE